MFKKSKDTAYHHGYLAESLLDAVEELASKFGLEAVTLRGCAKILGVSPSAAFKHYADKRALLTAFAVRAMEEMAARMQKARDEADQHPFLEVGLAYVSFALDKPALFQAMWRRELIDFNAPSYQAASGALGSFLKGGFGETLHDEDAAAFSPQEDLAWSTVHGFASLCVDGPFAEHGRVQNLKRARAMLEAMALKA